MAHEAAGLRQQKADSSALSWVDIDPDYESRDGYDAEFLGGVTVRLPSPDGGRLRAADLLGLLHYEHFSVRMHKARKIAAFTAVNISGKDRYQRTGREKDSWEPDPRAGDCQTTQPFYKSPFQRGHLVMRLDPVWGPKRTAERAEADTFHWTNCSPQHRRLNNPWWLSIEMHVLNTASTTRQRVCVFAGPILGKRDPVLRGVRVPLAYWKVIAWKKPGRGGGLRSLGFVVRQDAEVRAAVKAARVAPLALDFPDAPKRVRGYQTLVTDIEEVTGLRFGRLGDPSVDTYARARAGEPLAATGRALGAGPRPLRSIAELIVD